MKFSVEELIFFLTEERLLEDETATKEELICDYLQHEINEGYHGFSFIVNGKDIFKNYETSHLHNDLNNINNIFFALLKTYCNEPLNIVFDRPQVKRPFVSVFLDQNEVCFIPTKYFPELDETPIDITQAYEEVIRAVNEYKNIFWQVAKILAPNDLTGFMRTVFHKEDRYLGDTEFSEKYLYTSEWFPLENAWEKYKNKYLSGKD